MQEDAGWSKKDIMLFEQEHTGSFHCTKCGANVFRKHIFYPKYRCNGCGTQYENVKRE